MRIEAAQRAEENLPLQPEHAARLHDLSDLLELSADAGGGERRLQSGQARQCTRKNCALPSGDWLAMALDDCTREMPVSNVRSC